MSTDYDVEHPRAIFASHILNKGWQTGSIIGVGVVVPLLAYRRRGQWRILTQDFLPGALSAAGKTAVYVTAGTGVATLAMVALKPIDQEGIEDRAYRLHHNEGQKRTDRFALAGTVLGGIAAATGVSPSPGSIVLGGAAVGAALGVLAHVATSQSENVLSPGNMPAEILPDSVRK